MSLGKLVVVLVDDQAVMRSAMRRILERDNRFEVQDFASGFDANKFLDKNSVDLVITDIYMNRGTGFDVLAAIRGREMANDIPVIIVSGEATRDDIVHSIEQGASDYIIKPFEQDDLITKIDKVLTSYQSPSREEAMLRDADRAFLQADVPAATKIYTQLLSENHSSPRILNGLAHCYAYEKDNGRARALALQAIEKNGLYFRAYALLADLALAEENYAEAREFLTKELSINGKQLKRRVMLAELYLREDDEERGFEQYRHALLLSPKNESLLLSVANAHLRAGHVDKAVHYFVRCRKQHPTCRKAIQGVVSAYRTANRLDQALSVLGTLHRRNPGQWDVILARARVYESLGDFDKATADLEAFLARNPEETEAIQALANSLDKQGLHAEAAIRWSQLSQKLPTPENYARLGLSSLKSNDHQTAAKAYQRAADLAPHDVAIRFSLGFAYEQLKLVRRAYNAYVAAYRLQPDNPEIVQAIQRLSALVQLQGTSACAKNGSVPKGSASASGESSPQSSAEQDSSESKLARTHDALPIRTRGPKAS